MWPGRPTSAHSPWEGLRPDCQGRSRHPPRANPHHRQASRCQASSSKGEDNENQPSCLHADGGSWRSARGRGGRVGRAGGACDHRGRAHRGGRGCALDRPAGRPDTGGAVVAAPQRQLPSAVRLPPHPGASGWLRLHRAAWPAGGPVGLLVHRVHGRGPESVRLPDSGRPVGPSGRRGPDARRQGRSVRYVVPCGAAQCGPAWPGCLGGHVSRRERRDLSGCWAYHRSPYVRFGEGVYMGCAPPAVRADEGTSSPPKRWPGPA